MRKVIEYELCYGDSIPELNRDVMVMVRRGFEPFGQHQIIYAVEPTTGELLWHQYSQAVVLYEEKS